MQSNDIEQSMQINKALQCKLTIKQAQNKIHSQVMFVITSLLPHREFVMLYSIITPARGSQQFDNKHVSRYSFQSCFVWS